MENPAFLDDENIPLVTYHSKDCEGDHDNDYDDCNTPNTTVEETSFTTPSSTDNKSTSTLWFRQANSFVRTTECNR